MQMLNRKAGYINYTVWALVYQPQTSCNFLLGVDYIEFFDLDVKESTVKEEEVVPDSLGHDTSDYYSMPVFIENGIPIGATGELSSQLYVS